MIRPSLPHFHEFLNISISFTLSNQVRLNFFFSDGLRKNCFVGICWSEFHWGEPILEVISMRWCPINPNLDWMEKVISLCVGDMIIFPVAGILSVEQVSPYVCWKKFVFRASQNRNWQRFLNEKGYFRREPSLIQSFHSLSHSIFLLEQSQNVGFWFILEDFNIYLKSWVPWKFNLKLGAKLLNKRAAKSQSIFFLSTKKFKPDGSMVLS